jgi:hypothetical protein
MLRRIAIALVLLASLAMASWGQSQETPRQDTKSAEQQPNTKDGGANQSPSVINEPATKQAEKKTETGAANAKYEWFNGWSLSDKIAAFVVVVGFFQLLALLATYFVMRSTAQRQLRAYISDIAGTATFISDTESRIEIDIQFRNAGQTPAYSVEIRCAPPVIGRPTDRHFDTPSRFAPVKTIIGPGKEFSVRHRITQVSAVHLRQIQNAERAIWIWGRVDYVDAFNKARYLGFRCLALGMGQSWPLIPAPDGCDAN